MTTAVHAVNCQIQNPFRMMPLDVCAHLPIQLVEDFRTDQLVHDIGARPDIIPEAVRRHVPGAVVGLRERSDHDAIEEDVALLRPIHNGQAVIPNLRPDIADIAVPSR